MAFANYYYSTMKSDMYHRAKNSTECFADQLNQSFNEFYLSCITYARTFEDKDVIELQFINSQGKLVASSYGQWAGQSPTTSDITDAFQTGDIQD